MDGARWRGDLLIDPHQHGRRLGPGGGAVGGKGGGGGAVGHADGIGDLDVGGLLPGHIRKGDRSRERGVPAGPQLPDLLRRALEPQGPDQQLRHLAPGDGITGPEGLVDVHHIPLGRLFDSEEIRLRQV